VRYSRAIEVSVSPERTTYVVNVGAGLGVGRTNVGSTDGPGGEGLGQLGGQAGVAIGDGVGRGAVRMPGRAMMATTRTTATPARPKASQGEARTLPPPVARERRIADGSRGSVIAGV